MSAIIGSAAAMALEPRLDPPEDGDEHEVEIDFNDAPATALVTLANGVIHVDGLLHGGLYLDADDLSDSAQQRIAELARAAQGVRMTPDTESPPRGGEPDPLDGAGAVVVPLVVLAAVLAAALLAMVL